MNLNIYEKVGNNIHKFRKEKNMTLEELAFESDVNKNYLSDLERGTRNPTIMILERIAIALEVEIKELFY